MLRELNPVRMELVKAMILAGLNPNEIQAATVDRLEELVTEEFVTEYGPSPVEGEVSSPSEVCRSDRTIGTSP